MILLDTHVAIWILRNDAALGKKARETAVVALAEATHNQRHQFLGNCIADLERPFAFTR